MVKTPQEILDEFADPEEVQECFEPEPEVEPVGSSTPIKESREEKQRRLHGINFDANWGDDSTLQNCVFCNERFDSAKIPYRPTLCFRCFGFIKLQSGGIKYVGANAFECWHAWMRERFAEIAAFEHNHKRQRKTESLLKMIARVIGLPCVRREHLLEAVDRCYMLGEHKAFYQQWRAEMKKGISEMDLVPMIAQSEVYGPQDEWVRYRDGTPIMRDGEPWRRDQNKASEALPARQEQMTLAQMKLDLFGRN